jgi:hypothetical protein
MNDLDDRLRTSLQRSVLSPSDRLPAILAAGRQRRRRKTALVSGVGVVTATLLATGVFQLTTGRLGKHSVSESLRPEPTPAISSRPASTTDAPATEPSAPSSPTAGTNAVTFPSNGTQAESITLHTNGSVGVNAPGTTALFASPCGSLACTVADATFRQGTLWATTHPDGELPPTADRPAMIRSARSPLDAWTTQYTAQVGVSLGSVAIDSAGAMWVVASPTDGTPRHLLRVADGKATPVDDDATKVITSRDGRYLAYGIADPRTNKSEIVVRDLETQDERRLTILADRPGPSFYFPEPTQWSPDGRTLLVRTAFEGIEYGYLQPFEAISQADSTLLDTPHGDGTGSAAEAACLLNNEQILVARWTHPYADGQPQPGSLEVVDTRSGSVVSTYGPTKVIGNSMACLADGRAEIVTDTGRRVTVEPDGTTQDLGEGFAAVLVP